MGTTTTRRKLEKSIASVQLIYSVSTRRKKHLLLNEKVLLSYKKYLMNSTHNKKYHKFVYIPEQNIMQKRRKLWKNQHISISNTQPHSIVCWQQIIQPEIVLYFLVFSFLINKRESITSIRFTFCPLILVEVYVFPVSASFTAKRSTWHTLKIKIQILGILM